MQNSPISQPPKNKTSETKASANEQSPKLAADSGKSSLEQTGDPTKLNQTQSGQNLPSRHTSSQHTSSQHTSNQHASGQQIDRSVLQSFDAQILAQALAEKLAIAPNDWHRLSSNRSVRAREQAAAALVYMLKNQPDEAIPRLQQAIGWLDKTLKAPPCPTHAEKRH